MLTPGFAIAEATDTWLRHTAMQREQVLGRLLFEVLAERPNESAAGGPSELRDLLQRVMRLRQPDAMPVRRSHIPSLDGGFNERYWTLLNVPVCDENGQVAWIVHRVRDVTELVRLHHEGTERDELSREQQLLITRLRGANEELARRDHSLSESERRLAIATEAGRLGSWEMTLPDRNMASTPLHKACYGRGPDERFTHDELRAAIHPDDQARRQAALDAALIDQAVRCGIPHRLAGRQSSLGANPWPGDPRRGRQAGAHDRRLARHHRPQARGRTAGGSRGGPHPRSGGGECPAHRRHRRTRHRRARAAAGAAAGSHRAAHRRGGARLQ